MSDHHVLLQTDIVDSTRIAEQLGDEAWAALSEAHDVAARDLLPKWRGREIDKSDGFLLLFASVADAVGYAIDYHRASTGLAIPLAARAGIHVGSLVARDNSAAHVALGAKVHEVDGVAKPLTARVMAIAGGGQTLMTVSAQQALGGSTWRLQSHGYWRMKGLAEPLELFEVGGPHASFMPPQDSAKGYRVAQRNGVWLPKRDLGHSLPAERDLFVGRVAELAIVAARFNEGVRLLTVTGIGGSGKTRFAQRFAWTWLGEFPGGIWFCDLTQAQTTDGIMFAVAQGLGMALNSSAPITQLADAIAGRDNCLIVLDNFEQVVGHAEETLGYWLNRAPGAKFLVTSRELLNIAGESVFHLSPLDWPDGVTLFKHRARAARNDFAPSAEDKAAIGSLVELLDGLPLAIELAASRTSVMSPRALLARIGDRSRLLASVGGSSRHATLQATFDWSWEMLSIAEKAALAQVSVFEAGFSLEAAEAVIDLSLCGASSPWVVDVLQRLTDRSLVRRLPGERFGLFVSVHEYAKHKLKLGVHADACGQNTVTAVNERHGRWYSAIDLRALSATDAADTENIVIACKRALERADAPTAVACVERVWQVLRLSGPFTSALKLAVSVEAMKSTPVHKARTCLVLGEIHQALGQGILASKKLQFSIAIFADPAILEQILLAKSLCALGEVESNKGNLKDSKNHLTDAMSIAVLVDDAELRCRILNNLGVLANWEGDFSASLSYYESALAIAIDMGDIRWQGGLHGNIGGVYYARGRPEQAQEKYEQALDLSKRSGDRKWEGNSCSNLGLICMDSGDMSGAVRYLQKAVDIARSIGNSRLESYASCNWAQALESTGKVDQAGILFQRAIFIARELGDKSGEGQFQGRLGLWYSRAANDVDSMRCFDLGEACLQSVGDELNLGLLWCAKAEAANRLGLVAVAEDCVGAVKRTFAPNKLVLWPELEKRLRSLATALTGSR